MTDRGGKGDQVGAKLWLVAWHEYSRHALRRRFIFVLLSVPVVLALIVGAGYLVVRLEMDTTAVGYVDHAGLLADPVPIPYEEDEEQVAMVAFENEEDARRALQAKEIQAYYVLTPDYFVTNEVQLVYSKEPSEYAQNRFEEFLQVNWLAGRPEGVAERILEGPTVIYSTPDGSREFGTSPNLGNFLPFLLGVAFMVMVFTTSGYLIQAVAEEKENRTIEIVVTSISPRQLIVGKVVGIIAVGLTQFLFWMACALVAVPIAGRTAGLEFFQNITVDVQTLLVILIEWAAAYVMVAALMTAAGVTVAEAEQAQQIAGVVFVPFMAPIWLLIPIMGSPNGPLAVGLSFFPVTAPLTISTRMLGIQVPLWQVGVSTVLLILCAWGSLWLAGRAFRQGMLRYGRGLRLREIFRRSR